MIKNFHIEMFFFPLKRPFYTFSGFRKFNLVHLTGAAFKSQTLID